ncbi:Na/Pi symporter [Phaeobacter sp. QD34_3]|uniref:Na/Pi cotransporter family protein n=1 Tax=unclassified Phaeobacter TaxID=2621772 RepID=UPI00237F6365|nr:MULTISPECIES: Na/Pi symporter [unclassified Phaeobacter]MDE4134525.1 Na/Pi symporter [Phaeobacter sp. QD34_3]MDE4138184.1 Na/Pi symporter [Phaeobacter sp. QD34_24]
MTADYLSILGGIGMFLVGMKIMTAALRDAAGSNLRAVLTRFTTTPLRGVMTGTVSTAIIQSSSATTVMTVGFVGAGLLTMPQALGVIYGANIGTTATGWLVSILGFKLKLGSLAMAGLLLAGLADLLGRGRVARIGRMVSGLCLLLIGLDLMQAGMGDVSGLITPKMLPTDTLWGLIVLVGLGVGITIVMQSSSAAVALALVMVQGGALTLTQALAIVIGMNVGTTFTAILASLGGSRPMRQTALANLLFNVVTSVVALVILITGEAGLAALLAAVGPVTAVLIFHMGFNILGTVMFLPLTGRFAAVVARLVPEHPAAPLIHLDRALLQDPDLALVAAEAATATLSRRIHTALVAALQEPPDYRPVAALHAVETGVQELSAFLADIRLPEGRADQQRTYGALMHQIDHLLRLMERCKQTARIADLLEDPLLRRPARAFAMALQECADDSADLHRAATRLERLARLVEQRTNRHRRALMLGEHAGMYQLSEVFAHTDAMRWLQRSLHHAERIAFYGHVAREALAAARPAAAADPVKEP